jgi:hypothetical protein
MDIKRNGSRPSSKGPEAWFTGTVRVDPIFQVGDPARVSGGQVTFEPGARTMWHTHPLGQTLIVMKRPHSLIVSNFPSDSSQPWDISLHSFYLPSFPQCVFVTRIKQSLNASVQSMQHPDA